MLFTANATANLTIIGGGTRWRMQRADCEYLSAQFQFSVLMAEDESNHRPRAAPVVDMNATLYKHSEYRCGLAIVGVDGFRISDVTISDTGGDGRE